MRLLALDIDGTLVDERGDWFPGTLEAVARARTLGAEPTLVTGRGWPATQPVAAALGVRLPCVCYLGALTVDALTGQPVRRYPLDRDELEQLLQAAEAEGLALGLHSEAGRGWTRHPDDYLPPGPAGNVRGPALDDVRPLLRAPVAQVFVAGSRSVQAVLRLLPSLPRMQAIVYDQGTAQVRAQVIRSGVSKGTGLAELCRDLGLSPGDVLAAGDNAADLPMLAWAGRSVAMPGHEVVLQQAATLALPAGVERPLEAAFQRLLPGF